MTVECNGHVLIVVEQELRIQTGLLHVMANLVAICLHRPLKQVLQHEIRCQTICQIVTNKCNDKLFY